MSTDEGEFARALSLLQRGQGEEAEALLAQYALSHPEDAEGHNALGNARAQLGKTAAAEAAYRASIRIDSQLHKPHANLANLFVRSQRWAEASAALREATRLAPEAERLWTRLGQTLENGGQLAEAAEAYERAHGLGGGQSSLVAWARALLAGGQAAPAHALLSANDLGADGAGWALYAQACALTGAPDLARALTGAADRQQDSSHARALAALSWNHDEPGLAARFAAMARESSDEPFDDQLTLLQVRGLIAVGKSEEALGVVEAAFGQAPTPEKARALTELALRTGEISRVEAPLQTARVLFPEAVELLVDWGKLRLAVGDLDGCRTALSAALETVSDHPAVLRAMGEVEFRIGRIDQALAWIERAVLQDASRISSHHSLLWATQLATNLEPEAFRALLGRHQRRFGFVAKHSRPVAPDAAQGRKVRLGYWAPNLAERAVERFLEAALANHESEAFAVFLYGCGEPSTKSRAAQTAVRLDARSDREIADRIARDQLDVLLVLGGGGWEPHASRVLAYRPALRQGAWHGLSAAAALPECDFEISDAFLHLPDPAASTATRLLRLPCCAISSPTPSGSAPPPRRSSEAAVRLRCLGPSSHLSDELLQSFGRVLTALPQARLALESAFAGSSLLAERLRAALCDAAERVDLVAEAKDAPERSARLRASDLILDTFPVSGGEILGEALAMGLPVVTLAGDRPERRTTASMLSALGASHLISETPNGYESCVVTLAKNAEGRAQLGAELSRAMSESTIANPGLFLREFERALQQLADEPLTPRDSEGRRTVTTDQGAKLVLPDSLETISTFVFEEQRRWFEDEVPFVRKLITPGDCMVDVGVNLGAYAIEAAITAGPEGRVIAFEPSSATAALLRESVEQNGIQNFTLHQVALGEKESSATLMIASSPELSQLGQGQGPSEEVRVRPLSAFADAIEGMAFLKLDAEGSEIDILRGSGALIRDQAPVVMFELRHGHSLNSELLTAFAELDFKLYRLCPGLNALVPFLLDELDDFCLNLFAVRAPRDRSLAARGMLIEAAANSVSPTSDDVVEAYIESRPLLRGLGVRARDASQTFRYFVRSCDPSVSKSERFAALRKAAHESLVELGRDKRPELRLTASRVARDIGRRAMSISLTQPLLNSGTAMAPKQPFGCALEAYSQRETFEPSRVFTAQALEASIVWGGHSSFYQGSGSLSAMLAYFAAGGESPEMDRRLGLTLARRGHLP